MRPELAFCQKLTHISPRILRVNIKNLIAIFSCTVPVAVLQKHKRTFQKRFSLSCGGVIDNGCLIYNRLLFVAFGNLLYTTNQVLHKAKLSHILCLQVRKFLRQIVRVHITVSRNKRFLLTVLYEHKKSAPLVLNPNGIEIFGLCADNNHYLCTVQSGEYVRLILLPQLVFKGNSCKENLVALLRKLMIKVVCENGISRPSAVRACFLVADEHVKRLFLLRNCENTFLYFVNRRRLTLINRLLNHIGIFYRRLVILVHKNGSVLSTIDCRHTLVSCRVFNVLDTVTAQHQRPVSLAVGFVLFENLLVHRHSLVEFVVSAEVIRTVVHIRTSVVVKLRQGLLSTAVQTFADA